MKPYFRTIWNSIRYSLLCHLRCKNLIFKFPNLLGYNTRLVVDKTSYVYVGKKVISDGRCSIIADKNARIEIGEGVYFNEGMMISSKKSVVIGAGCQFGPNVKIFDNDHCFNRKQGVLSKHNMESIVIGKNCWIASNTVILRGSVIGDNCVIGAGCIVKGNIPTASIVTQENSLKIVSLKE